MSNTRDRGYSTEGNLPRSNVEISQDNAVTRENTRLGQMINNILDAVRDPVGTVRDFWKDQAVLPKEAPGVSPAPSAPVTIEDPEQYTMEQYFRTENGVELRVFSDRTDGGSVLRGIAAGHEMATGFNVPSPTQDIAAAAASRMLTEMRDERDGPDEQDLGDLAFGARNVNGDGREDQEDWPDFWAIDEELER